MRLRPGPIAAALSVLTLAAAVPAVARSASGQPLPAWARPLVARLFAPPSPPAPRLAPPSVPLPGVRGFTCYIGLGDTFGLTGLLGGSPCDRPARPLAIAAP